MSENKSSSQSSKSFMGFQAEVTSTSRVVRREVASTAKRGLNEAEVQLLKRYRGRDFFKAKDTTKTLEQELGQVAVDLARKAVA